MRELKSEFLFTIKIGVSKLHDIGQTPIGLRHIDILSAGSFEGPRLRGEVLSGGMDQKVFRPDGAMNPNVRLVVAAVTNCATEAAGYWCCRRTTTP